MTIPYLDLISQADSKAKYLNLIEEVLDSGIFIGGKFTEIFIEKMSEAHENCHVIPTSTGTDSLFVALKALDIKPGDEVIVPACSWISTSEVVSLCGAKPVFIDVNENHLINTTLIANKLTSKTRAIICVHLFGEVCQMKELLRICKKHNLFLVEDCAQAAWASLSNQKVGTFGDIGCFSFYPSKNLGALGDAGCITTKNDKLRETIKRVCNHGALNKYDHVIEGYNSRMDELQAAVLSEKINFIDQQNHSRVILAQEYEKHLNNIGEIILPNIKDDMSHVYHVFVVRCRERDALKIHLESKGIQTLLHYPTALPFLDCYKKENYTPKDFPMAYELSLDILSLPLYPSLDKSSVKIICEEIRNFYRIRKNNT